MDGFRVSMSAPEITTSGQGIEKDRKAKDDNGLFSALSLYAILRAMSNLTDVITRQQPVGSGFDASTTAAQVLAGLDLTGKTAIVTGGHSGLGFQTTRELAGAGVRVIVAARDAVTARAATQSLPGVIVETLDLADLDSVRAFATRILASGRHIDMLVNNAGIMACPEQRVGPGWEAQFAINHLGHFALTNHLWPALVGGARVISVSSAAHQLSPIRWDDVQFERDYDKWLAYGQAKTANVLFAVQLDRLGRGAGVRAFALHPGKILTPLQRHLTQDEMIGAGWIDASGAPADPTFKTPQQGAATAVWTATSPQLDGLGGVYCEDCDIARRSGNREGSAAGMSDHAVDVDQAARLWRHSAELTGIDAVPDTSTIA
ncbi:SDR family NAD(P)-dependent oxidoreductase [Sphingomonas naphthae]|uniref:SDR family NAD(P)-dependent oxidoreductase n=1 Tax=Sphingomonas naphthae TaxID=1813468 RepID=A0ABY7TM96_9SPHN|nr:SDR family NAD(P)-dependent oxidoreductase [Sphingomonas naphthae]WCT74299.1 SDR family NAD(P)-dependent oxidoreductase [Sphingomonas naphthae]